MTRLTGAIIAMLVASITCSATGAPLPKVDYWGSFASVGKWTAPDELVQPVRYEWGSYLVSAGVSILQEGRRLQLIVNGTTMPTHVGDLDCNSFSAPVMVGNNDPHRLDRDGDGIGCE